jgi:Bacterial regulatory protein, Fis family
VATLGPASDPVGDGEHPADLQVLAAWAPELADTFVALSCDIALVVDGAGRITRLAQHDSHPIAPPGWIGADWAQTVSADSRDKIEQILAEVAASGQARRREVNHPDSIGGPTPVAYSAARLGGQGPTLAIGHDLRAQSALQQRFLAAQEALERSYWNAQRRSPAQASDPPALMTRGERTSLGLGTAELDDTELVRALGRLVERIDHGALPVLLRDARRLAERHFIARALQRAGSEEELAKTLGVSRRTLSRRKKKR